MCLCIAACIYAVYLKIHVLCLGDLADVFLTADDWSLGHVLVSGEEDICIGGQSLSLIFAPVSSGTLVFSATLVTLYAV